LHIKAGHLINKNQNHTQLKMNKVRSSFQSESFKCFNKNIIRFDANLTFAFCTQVLICLALLLAVTVAVPQGRFFGGGLFGRPVVGLRPIGGGFGGLGGLGGLGGFGKIQ
jgi:hypothetical protein